VGAIESNNTRFIRLTAMFTDLDVKLTRPVEIDLLLPKIGAALKEILCLTISPDIKAERYDDDDEVFLPRDFRIIDQSSGTVTFKIADEPELADVVPCHVEHPMLSNEEQGDFLSVSSRSRRTPLEHALLAAVAAALSAHLDTPVIDDMSFFIEASSGLPAGEFVNTIRMSGHFDDYRKAATYFYGSLPRKKSR
jgi:hypothetical protein